MTIINAVPKTSGCVANQRDGLELVPIFQSAPLLVLLRKSS